MKKKMVALMLAGAMVLSLVACGSKEEQSGSGKGQIEVDGNKLDTKQFYNGFMSSDPSTLDSAKGNDGYGNGVLLNIMEPLTRMDEQKGKNVRIGAAAESWESNEDGTVWTFKLRDNKWADGKEVTADDYAYGIQYTLDQKTGSPNAYLITCIKNGVAVNSGEKAVSDLGIKVIDKKTLEITLENPTPYFLSLTDTRAMLPIRKDYVEKYGEAYGAEPEKVIGNGPFKIKKWTHNSEMVLEKSKEYWDQKNVYLTAINWKIITDEIATFNSFENGSLDSCTSGTPEWIEKFKSKDNVVYTESVIPSIRFFFFNTKDAFFKNENIRKAFSIAIDRKDVAKTIFFDTMIPSYSWVPQGVSTGEQGDYRKQVKEPLKTMSKEEDAKKLLLKGMDELGLGSDPSKVTVKFSMGGTNQWLRNFGEYFQQEYKKTLGVNIKLDANEWGTFQSKTNSGDYQMGYMVWGIDYNDPISMLGLMQSKAGSIPTFWENKEYDELIANASIEMNESKRVEMYKKAEELLFNGGCALCPVVNETSHAFRYSYIKNASTLSFTTMGLKKVYTSGR